MRRWLPALLCAGMAQGALGQPVCRPPYMLSEAPTFIHDYVMARRSCGRDEPEVAEAARHAAEIAFLAYGRLTTPAEELRFRGDIERFIEVRRRRYTENPLDFDCNHPQLSEPVAVVLETIARAARALERETTRGGELSRLECR